MSDEWKDTHYFLLITHHFLLSVVNFFFMTTAYLSLTSLAGDRAANLLRALSAIFIGNMHLNSASSIYEIQNEAGNSVALTIVISLSAERLEAFSLKKYCQSTEDRLSRKALIERGERSIEIDLLLMEDQVIEEKRDDIQLVLPHPYLHRRRDLLMPLTEIAPHLQHPALGETMTHLLGAVEDSTVVKIYRG